MVSFSLYRGPAHVCVASNDEFADHFGDVIGLPVREQFPELSASGLFDAMDTVYLSMREVEMTWRSAYDGQLGRMLILPWRDEAESGVGLHFYPAAERPALVDPALLHAVGAIAVAVTLVPLFL